MMKTWMPTLLALSCLPAAEAIAQERAPARSPSPLQVELVIVRRQAGRDVARLPYTLTCNADEDRRSSLRLGVEVPVDIGAGKGVQYRNVGTNVDCQATTLDAGRYRLLLSVEQSSMFEAAARPRRPEGGAASDVGADNPMFRTFNSTFNAILREGQNALYTAATDPVSGEEVTIEVTLKAMK